MSKSTDSEALVQQSLPLFWEAESVPAEPDPIVVDETSPSPDTVLPAEPEALADAAASESMPRKNAKSRRSKSNRTKKSSARSAPPPEDAPALPLDFPDPPAANADPAQPPQASMKETPDPGSETPAVAALDPNHDETTEHDHEHESVALTTETTSAEQDATAADLTDEAPRPQLKIALKRRTIEAPPQAEPPPAEPPPVRDPIATDEPKVIPPPPPTPERIRLEDEPAAETAPPRLVLKSKAAVAPAADQTLGELFQLARHQLDQSARQVADITRLSPDFINAAESDRLAECGLAPIYCRHNLKLLARHYGIDETEVLRRYDDAAPTGGPALDPDVLLPKAERADSAGLSTGRSAPRGKAGIVVSWVLTGLIVIGVAVALTMMLRNRRQAAPLPVAAEQAAPTPIDDDQLERFIHPESLPFTELPVPVNP